MDEQQPLQPDQTPASRRGAMSRPSRRRLLQGSAGAVLAGFGGRALLRSSGASAAALLPPSSSPELIRQLGDAMSHYFYIKMHGIKQGTFASEVTDPGGLPAVQGIGFEQTITSPRDAASGQATGRRQYSPIVITKEWGAASPQLFQALVTNESLNTVEFTFYESTPAGAAPGPQLFFTIKLTNAFVSKIEKYENFNAAGHQDSNDERFLEDISFTFQKIEMVHQASLGTSTDSAVAGQG